MHNLLAEQGDASKGAQTDGEHQHIGRQNGGSGACQVIPAVMVRHADGSRQPYGEREHEHQASHVPGNLVARHLRLSQRSQHQSRRAEEHHLAQLGNAYRHAQTNQVRDDGRRRPPPGNDVPAVRPVLGIEVNQQEHQQEFNVENDCRGRAAPRSAHAGKTVHAEDEHVVQGNVEQQAAQSHVHGGTRHVGAFVQALQGHEPQVGGKAPHNGEHVGGSHPAHGGVIGNPAEYISQHINDRHGNQAEHQRQPQAVVGHVAHAAFMAFPPHVGNHGADDHQHAAGEESHGQVHGRP